MKKIFLIMIVFLSIISFANAEMSIGVKGGINLTKVRIDNMGEYNEYGKMKLGYSAGIPIQFKIIDFFAVQPEILVSMKGIKIEDDEGYYETNRLTYLEIPLLFKLLIPREKLMPNFYAGPELAIRFSTGTSITTDNPILTDGNGRNDLKENTNPVDLLLVFGGGLSLPAGPGNLDFDIRYSLGLVNILSEKYLDYSLTENQSSMKFGTISLLIGYSFTFGG